jgi:hypothetical protein
MIKQERNKNKYSTFEKEILEKLDLIIRLLSLDVVKDAELRAQVKRLSELGFKPREIAGFLGKTPNHIRVILSELRKKKQEVKTLGNVGDQVDQK